MKRQLQLKKKTANDLSFRYFSVFIYDFRISNLHNLLRGGTPCILSGATYYRQAGRAGCWPACHLIGPFLVVILSLRMESHSPTTTFQPKWKRDFFSPMSWPTQNAIILANLLLRSEFMFEFFFESLIYTFLGSVIEHS